MKQMGNFKSKIFTALVFLLVVMFTFTGCDSSVTDGSDIAYVSFASGEGSARGIDNTYKLMYPVDSLYWAYTAVKVDGNYTVGQSEVVTTGHVDGLTVADTIGTENVELLLRPVKDGPATGLGVKKPFSVGQWIFKLYGYKSVTVNASGKAVFTDLLYTGVQNVTLDKGADANASQEVIFELADVGTDTKGTVGFGSFKLKVPRDQEFFGSLTGGLVEGAEILVRVWNTAKGVDANLVAESTTVLDADKVPGDEITLSPFAFVEKSDGSFNNEFESGIHEFDFVAMYKDQFTAARDGSTGSAGSDYKYTGDDAKVYKDGYAAIGEIIGHEVEIRTGRKAVLEGVINEMDDAQGTTGDVPVAGAVAKIEWDAGTEYYKSLEEATKVYDGTKDIILVGDVESATINATSLPYSSKTAVIRTNGHFLDNISLAEGYTLNIKTSATGDTPVFTYKGGTTATTLKNFKVNAAPATKVWMTTDKGELTVDASETVTYINHSGNVDNLTITSCPEKVGSVMSAWISSGYVLDADVEGDGSTKGVVTVKKGFVQFRDKITITKLIVDEATAGDTELSAEATDGVLYMSAIYYGTTELKNSAKDYVNAVSALDASQIAFKKITLSKNGATSGTDKFVYVISGADVKLPPLKDGATTIIDYTKTGNTFMHWSSKAAPTSPTDGDRYADGDSYVSTADATLYALWAQPVGGRIFNVKGFDKTKYHFYGVAHGTVNELTEWYGFDASTDAGAVDAAKALKDAVYYTVNGTDSKVLAVATVTDPTASTGVRPDVGFYTTSGGTVAEVLRSAVATTLNSTTTEINGVTGWRVGKAAEYDLLKAVEIDNVFFSRFWSSEGGTPAVFKLYERSTGNWIVIGDTDTTTKGRILPVRTL